MIRPVILCGGAGTRLWPLSRALFPKQLLPLTGEQSLLQQTAARLTGENFAPALVVSSEDQRIFIKRQLEQIGAPCEAIILEPMARNTSAAAALAAAWLHSRDGDELMLLMPSDHVILDREAFMRAIAVGAPHAEAGAIVTFGAEPTEPNTQYGYIEARRDEPSGDGAFPIRRFVEKPNQATAAEYLESGGFYWNAGIFLLKPSTLLEEMRRFLPDSLEAITTALEQASREGIFVRPEAKAFNAAQNISIDHAIMEKTSRGIVVPVKMEWSDVGSWDAVWKLAKKDLHGNATKGDVVALHSRDSLVRVEDGAPLVAAVGLQRMAVIATADAVLVAPLERVSEVKEIVEALKAENRDCVASPPNMGPSSQSNGSGTHDAGVQINRIIVSPGDVRSQPGQDKPQHWIVLRGSAELTIDGKVSTFQANDATYIPQGAKTRLANVGDDPLEVVEVQHARTEGLASLAGKLDRGSAHVHKEGTIS